MFVGVAMATRRWFARGAEVTERFKERPVTIAMVIRWCCARLAGAQAKFRTKSIRCSMIRPPWLAIEAPASQGHYKKIKTERSDFE